MRRSLGIGWWDVNRGQLLFAGVLTAATIATWIVMLSQNKIMRGQIEQTDITIAQMRLENRPWIGIDSVALEQLEEGQPIRCHLMVKNYGPSPAFIDGQRYLFIMYDISDEELAELATIEPYPPVGDMEQVIPPNKQVRIPMISQELPAGWADEIAGGARPMKIIGAVFYRDAADIRHGTGFCLFYEKGEGQLHGYPKYNYMQ